MRNIIKNTLVLGLSILWMSGALTLVAAEKQSGKPKAYPLDKCLVSDEKLGGMGKPYVIVYEGQEIKLCCKGCEKDFKKDPTKYMKKLEAAQKQKAK